MKRRFTDAFYELRCKWDITLPDGSKAQCGRAQKIGQLCTQHAKMHATMTCEYCGMNDDLPPDHCTDCTRPNEQHECVYQNGDGTCLECAELARISGQLPVKA